MKFMRLLRIAPILQTGRRDRPSNVGLRHIDRQEQIRIFSLLGRLGPSLELGFVPGRALESRRAIRRRLKLVRRNSGPARRVVHAVEAHQFQFGCGRALKVMRSAELEAGKIVTAPYDFRFVGRAFAQMNEVELLGERRALLNLDPRARLRQVADDAIDTESAGAVSELSS